MVGELTRVVPCATGEEGTKGIYTWGMPPPFSRKRKRDEEDVAGCRMQDVCLRPMSAKKIQGIFRGYLERGSFITDEDHGIFPKGLGTEGKKDAIDSLKNRFVTTWKEEFVVKEFRDMGECHEHYIENALSFVGRNKKAFASRCTQLLGDFEGLSVATKTSIEAGLEEFPNKVEIKPEILENQISESVSHTLGQALDTIEWLLRFKVNGQIIKGAEVIEGRINAFLRKGTVSIKDMENLWRGINAAILKYSTNGFADAGLWVYLMKIFAEKMKKMPQLGNDKKITFSVLGASNVRGNAISIPVPDFMKHVENFQNIGLIQGEAFNDFINKMKESEKRTHIIPVLDKLHWSALVVAKTEGECLVQSIDSLNKGNNTEACLTLEAFEQYMKKISMNAEGLCGDAGNYKRRVLKDTNKNHPRVLQKENICAQASVVNGLLASIRLDPESMLNTQEDSFN